VKSLTDDGSNEGKERSGGSKNLHCGKGRGERVEQRLEGRVTKAKSVGRWLRNMKMTDTRFFLHIRPSQTNINNNGELNYDDCRRMALTTPKTTPAMTNRLK
jgi:hypothetical protein